MSTTSAVITAAQLTNAAATYYTCPTNKKATVKNLSMCNSTGTARTFTVHLVPSGGTASASNMIVSARGIAAGESQIVWEMIGKALAAGDFIQALSDAGTAVTISGATLETT